MLIISKLPHNFFYHKFKRALWASDSFVFYKSSLKLIPVRRGSYFNGWPKKYTTP